MIKKFLLATLGIILCSTISVAQNTVSQEEYEKWIDYVNCKYIVAFVEKKIAQKSSEIDDKFRKEYSNNKLMLDVNSFYKIPKYNEIKKAIGSYQKTKALSKYINDKKSSLQQDWDKNQLINYLVDLPLDQPSPDGNGFKGYLTNETNTLKKDLQKQIPDSFFVAKEKQEKVEQPQEDVKQMVEQNTSKTQQVIDNNTKTKTEHSARSGNSFWAWFVWLCIIAVTFILIYRFRNEVKKWLKHKFGSHITNKNTLTEVKDEKTTSSKDLEIENKRLLQNLKQWENDNAKLNTENQQLKNKIIELQQQINELKNKEQLKNEAFPKIESNKETPEIRKSNKLYAANIIDGIFNKVTELPNDYSVFELTTLSQSTASFTVYRNAYSRVLVAPEFIEGCEKQMLSDTPSNLEIETGEARYNNESGKWQMIKKAKIKFV